MRLPSEHYSCCHILWYCPLTGAFSLLLLAPLLSLPLTVDIPGPLKPALSSHPFLSPLPQTQLVQCGMNFACLPLLRLSRRSREEGFLSPHFSNLIHDWVPWILLSKSLNSFSSFSLNFFGSSFPHFTPDYSTGLLSSLGFLFQLTLYSIAHMIFPKINLISCQHYHNGLTVPWSVETSEHSYNCPLVFFLASIDKYMQLSECTMGALSQCFGPLLLPVSKMSFLHPSTYSVPAMPTWVPGSHLRESLLKATLSSLSAGQIGYSYYTTILNS